MLIPNCLLLRTDCQIQEHKVALLNFKKDYELNYYESRRDTRIHSLDEEAKNIFQNARTFGDKLCKLYSVYATV